MADEKENNHDLKITAEMLANYLRGDPEIKEEIIEKIAKETGFPRDKAEFVLQTVLKILRDTTDESARLN
ncbi:MAG: hypothetical protein IH588_19995 [Anaerolineales bacterium]|nr:hypothetical protein [Anaerolineales bacterium]